MRTGVNRHCLPKTSTISEIASPKHHPTCKRQITRIKTMPEALARVLALPFYILIQTRMDDDMDEVLVELAMGGEDFVGAAERDHECESWMG